MVQVREQVTQLLDLSSAAVVAAEVAYLRNQWAALPDLEQHVPAHAECRRCA